MKKRYWFLLTILLTGFLVLRAFPASWVLYAVQQAAPGLQVANVTGSLWQGRANYSQWVDRGHTLPLGELTWTLQGLSLLTLSPCVNFSVQMTEQAIKGKACYDLLSARARASNVDISMPVDRIAPFFNVDVGGLLDIYIERLTWYRQQFGATDMSLVWQQASLYNGQYWVDLGDIQSLVNDDGSGGLVSEWSSIKNGQGVTPVDINLNATVTELAQPKPALRVTGTVTPGPNAMILGQMLQFVGEATGTGTYRIDISE